MIPRTRSIWGPERAWGRREACRTPAPNYWLFPASPSRKQAPSTKYNTPTTHRYTHRPRRILHVHTNTWCTLCVCDGDSFSNNTVESNNGKTTTNSKTILHEDCGTVVERPFLSLYRYCQNNQRRREGLGQQNLTVLFSVTPPAAGWPLNLQSNTITWDQVAIKTAWCCSGWPGQLRHKAIWTF